MRDLPALPETWAWTTFGQIARTGSGGTPSRSRPDFYGGDIPWLKSGELRDGLVTATEETITKSALASSSAKVFPLGTLCVALYGATVGRIGVLGIESATNQAVCGIFLPPGISTAFAFRYLESRRADLIERGKGGAQSNISQEIIRSLEFPLPPRVEQERIVAAIEQHLSDIDAGVAALERAQANLKRYRASVLKAACEGRLVPTEAELARKEKRKYEPADVLLARILKERRARWESDQLARTKAKGSVPRDGSWKAKYQEPEAPDTSALGAAPEGWAWTTLKRLSEIKGGVAKGQKRRPGDVLREVPYLRVANVQRGFLELEEVKTIEATVDEVEELRLARGDVLFNEGGDRDKLGRGWIWEEQLPLCIHQNHVFRARVIDPSVHPKLVSWYGNTFGQKYFQDEGKQTTNLASINMTKLGALPVPLPPAAEQIRIVAEVERLLSMADETEQAVRVQLARAARLRQSVLKRAFEGKLVPQDPSDEPASATLERIRMSASGAARPKRLPKRSGRKQPVAET